jgi:hypothetical protein
VKTYGASEEYVAGARFEHVLAPDVELVLLDNIDNNIRPGAYINYSEFSALIGRRPSNWSGTISGPVYGSFIGHSRIGTLVGEWNDSRTFAVQWQQSRLRHNYLGNLTVNLFSGSYEITNCSIEQMYGARFGVGTVIEYNTFEYVEWRDPQNTTLRYNNFIPAAGAVALKVLGSTAASTNINAPSNYWGSAATQQMEQLGATADIDVIDDFYDDFDQVMVDYGTWNGSAVTAAGPDW